MRRSLVITDARIWTAESEYAAAVAAAEARAGFDVAVAAPAGSDILEAVDGYAEAIALPGGEPSRSPADLLADVRFLSGLAGRSRFDVVHTSRSAAHLAGALAVGRRSPLVHLRGGASAPKRHAANRYLYRRLTSAVVASSSRVAKWVVDGLRVPAHRVHTILAPVDVSAFRPTAPDPSLLAELGVGDRRPVVVNVARLAPVKGHAVLLEAFARVAARWPAAVLVLVGEPWSGQPEGLRRLASDLGIQGAVVFAGRRSDVPRFLGIADVCVSSSVGSEANSRAVSEYMASGRPVVATRVGVIPDLVDDGRTGVLVDPGDPRGLADGIARILSDPEGARAMGVRAREWAAGELSPGAFGDRLKGVLESVGGRA
jgi:glycosyltransferase involved in cell wall biosynthesis